MAASLHDAPQPGFAVGTLLPEYEDTAPLRSARAEWATMWPLPLTSMLGVSGSALFAFSSGVFMDTMTGELGWTRAQYSTAFLLQMLTGLVFGPLVGRLIDRVGPRRVALFGIVPFVLTFCALGLTDRPIWSWWLLCIFVAIAQAFIGQTVWVAAIIGRFKASRGLALAITLAGLGLGSLAAPLLAALFLRHLGWRLAFPALVLTWFVIAAPLTLAFFHGGERQDAVRGRQAPIGPALRSRTFIGLMLAGGLFASGYFGLTVHMVAILREGGIDLTTAAGLAGLTGLFSIVGRIVTGYFLDRLPTRPIAVTAFLLPGFACLLLGHAHPSVWVGLLCVALLGLGSGAELDVITFVAARRFGERVFGSVYAIFMVVISLCASSGPLLAGALYDHYRSYGMFLAIMPVMVFSGAMLMAWVLASSVMKAED